MRNNMKLLFATGNPNKVREVRQMLGPEYEIQSLADLGFHEEIPENEPTLEGNALEKARFLHRETGMSCFAEDTGLEIDALNGEPGVITARYAGPEKDPEANMDLALQKLEGNIRREAQFRTVIALILDGKEHLFEGIARGSIATEKYGDGGFGYDPIFIPKGFGTTFAEMDSKEKNAISHRGKAIRKLIDFLLKNK
jgi:XTP/dITP diphosphohydrolase